jgi:hypothetical protein
MPPPIEKKMVPAGVVAIVSARSTHDRPELDGHRIYPSSQTDH